MFSLDEKFPGCRGRWEGDWDRPFLCQKNGEILVSMPDYELEYVIQEFPVNKKSCTVIYLTKEGWCSTVVPRPLDKMFPDCRDGRWEGDWDRPFLCQENGENLLNWCTNELRYVIRELAVNQKIVLLVTWLKMVGFLLLLLEQLQKMTKLVSINYQFDYI